MRSLVRGQGYRLTIDETGSEALRACLPRQNDAFIRATAGIIGKTGAFVFLDKCARELHRFTFDTESHEQRNLITGQVDRRTLRQGLVAGLGDRVRFGTRLSFYREEAGRVKAYFDDGSSAEGDILVGADGRHSTVRHQRMPERQPRDTGLRAIFDRTYVGSVTLPVLGPLPLDTGIMAVGPRGSLFFGTAMRFRERPANAAARLGIEGMAWPSQDYFMWAVRVREPAKAAAPTNKCRGCGSPPCWRCRCPRRIPRRLSGTRAPCRCQRYGPGPDPRCASNQALSGASRHAHRRCGSPHASVRCSRCEYRAQGRPYPGRTAREREFCFGTS